MEQGQRAGAMAQPCQAGAAARRAEGMRVRACVRVQGAHLRVKQKEVDHMVGFGRIHQLF